MTEHSVLHEVLRRLETIERRLQTIERTLIATEGRLHKMTQQTQDLLTGLGTLSGEINQLLVAHADLVTKLSTSQAVQNDPDVTAAIAQVQDMGQRVATALQNVATAAPAAASSTGTTAPPNIASDAQTAQATVDAAAPPPGSSAA